MNQESNNDIDILLRKLSRSDGNALNATANAEHLGREHLDADELNAYAENALPSALRVQYTEHLTECTNCRKIVTQLSLASAVVVRERVEEARPSTLKKFLAALFSPLVFRYAVPAMAIVVVVGIAWVALRQSRRSELAQNVSSQSPAPAPTNDFGANTSPNSGELKKTVSDPKESQARAEEKAAATPDSVVNKQEAIQEEKKVATEPHGFRDREDLARQNQQPVAPAVAGAGTQSPASVPPSPKADAAAEQSRVEVAQKKESEADKNKAMNEPPAATPSSRPAKSAEVQSGAKLGAADSTASRRATRESRAKDEMEAGEVRTVGGHRFQKRGDVWIDSLYSSQRITNVSRGSEQYRALVADEPGIHSIAEQLKTQLIVVWNGRAYFIK